ncbi:MAG: phenylalanine--tRNA ligase subunit beta [Bacteroidales bacterium]|nr:phenylalanine--tRNA ligase subunit beta [Bacteroidales bacterium]
MKISYNWLKSLINTEIDPQLLSKLLTDTGLEVEALDEISTVKGGLKGIVTGKVVSCKKHPNADKLSLTKVDIGNAELLNIVCGAPNVAEGQNVLVATLGAVLFINDNELIIKRTKIRGEDSEGMICAEDELGLGTSHEGIMVLPEDVPVGIKASEYFNIENDWVFEIGLTPNRADATSHLGVARDIFAALKNNNILSETEKDKIRLNCKENESLTQKSDNSILTEVEILDKEACKRYTGITIKNVIVKESPSWLKNKLKFIGLKPINNIVDISNYILFHLGQPLHIFDADRIAGRKIIVQKFNYGFDFTTLDGAIQKMSPDDLMICDTEKPLCIAGVYGGLNSGITQNTSNIFIESAYFNPVSIRKTAKRLGLKTDSSFRFERGTDPNMTDKALIQAANMISELAGGIICSPIIDVYPEKINPFKINFDFSYFDKIAGKMIDRNVIKNILKTLDISIENESEDALQLSVPPFRVDVTRPCDIAEEVLRIYGYNNIEIPNRLNASLSYHTIPEREKILDTLSNFLSSRSYNEIMCNSLSKSDYYEKLNYFDKNHCVRIINPLSKELEIMRQTLLFSALETVALNNNHKTLNFKLFELGKTYHKKEGDGLNKYKEEYHLSLIQTGQKENETWKNSKSTYDFYSLKADVNDVLLRIGIKPESMNTKECTGTYFQHGLSYYSGENVTVTFGKIDAKLLSFFDIKAEVYFADFNCDMLISLTSKISHTFKPVSKYPKMRRDLALLIDEKINFNEIEKLAKDLKSPILKGIGLFDIYKGDKIEKGKKSYAVSFDFVSYEKTLTDEEVDKVMQKLIKLYSEKLGAVIR